MGLDMCSKESGMLHSESDFSIDCDDYRKGLVTRGVGTCEYHLNDRGERFGKWLEDSHD